MSIAGLEWAAAAAVVTKPGNMIHEEREKEKIMRYGSIFSGSDIEQDQNCRFQAASNDHIATNRFWSILCVAHNMRGLNYL